MEDTVAVAWPEGLVALYRDHYVRMVRLAFLLTGSNAHSEEVVQDAFIRLRTRPDLADPAAYLRTMVVNACRDQIRRRLLHDRVTLRLAREEAVVDPVDELRDALDVLPERQRAVLVLRYYEGMSEAEIASVLGCRPGTVKSLAHRGLERLRGVLGA